MAPPVVTFLSKHDFSDKKIIPFASHGGGGEQRCLTDISKVSSSITVLNGIAFYASQAETASSRILEWLRELEIFNSILS